MRVFAVTLAVSSLFAGSTALLADPIPYPTSSFGTVAPTVGLVATGTSITVYYDGSAAADLDSIDVLDVSDGKSTGDIFPINNPGLPAIGDSVVLNGLTVGDTIIVDLINASTGKTVSSDPADSADGINHAYITPIVIGSFSGYYVGMEDLTVPGSDLDYNDEVVVLTGVSPAAPTPAPEPGSIALLGTGMLGMAGMLRRRVLARA